MTRYLSRASLPFGATLRGSPVGAGEGCSAPFDPPEARAPAERVLTADRRTVTASAHGSPPEQADWRAKATVAGVPLSASSRMP